jgi:hypothetical protein
MVPEGQNPVNERIAVVAVDLKMTIFRNHGTFA